MKRSAIAAAVVLAIIAAFLFIAGTSIGDKALVIDNIHWEGNPLTPCFVDAVHCGGHVLGSDENGRDLADRLIVGGGVTLGTALLALLGELAVAFGLALAARRTGSLVAGVITAFADGMSALPRVPFAFLLAIVAFSMLPKGAYPGTPEIAAWFAVMFWPRAFALFRAAALPAGVARRSIADVMTIVLVSSAVEFFGYGHGPATPSWGGMLSNVESNMEVAWWAAVFPAACIFAVVLLLEIVRRGLPPGVGARCGSGEKPSMKGKWASVITSGVLLLLFAASNAASADTPLDRASALFDKHDYKGAITLLDKIIAQDPKNVNALVMRGDARDNDGDRTGALEDYNAAIAINPDYEYAYATRCGTQVELSHHRDAVADCTKALSLSAKDDMALRLRSAAYYFLGDYQLAADDAQAAMEIDGKQPGNLLANCRASVGMLKDDLQDCTTYISYQPDDSDGYFYRGRIYMIDDKPDQAKADFHKVLQLDATYTAAHYWLADILLQQKSYDESISEADAFLAQYANDADTLMIRARAEQGLGQGDAARADGRTALQQYRIQNDSDGEARAQAFLKGLSSR